MTGHFFYNWNQEVSPDSYREKVRKTINSSASSGLSDFPNFRTYFFVSLETGKIIYKIQANSPV